jgi:hypothetical protein
MTFMHAAKETTMPLPETPSCWANLAAVIAIPWAGLQESFVPPSIEGALAALVAEHACEFSARDLTLAPGDPRLESAGGKALLDIVTQPDQGSLASRKAEIRAILHDLTSDARAVWPGSDLIYRAGRIVLSDETRLTEWTDEDSGVPIGILKTNELYLTYYDPGIAVGPQVMAMTSSSSLVIPDLIEALHPLPATREGLPFLALYAWSETSPGSGAWTGVDPDGQLSTLTFELDPTTGLVAAASTRSSEDSRSDGSACLLEYGPLGNSPGQLWLKSLMTIQSSGGGLFASTMELREQDLHPDAGPDRLRVPRGAHLYDQRVSDQVYYGTATPWPKEIEQRIQREAPSTPIVRGELADAAQHDHAEIEPPAAPGLMRLPLSGTGWVVLGVGVLLTLAPRAGRSRA